MSINYRYYLETSRRDSKLLARKSTEHSISSLYQTKGISSTRMGGIWLHYVYIKDITPATCIYHDHSEPNVVKRLRFSGSTRWWHTHSSLDTTQTIPTWLTIEMPTVRIILWRIYASWIHASILFMLVVSKQRWKSENMRTTIITRKKLSIAYRWFRRNMHMMAWKNLSANISTKQEDSRDLPLLRRKEKEFITPLLEAWARKQPSHINEIMKNTHYPIEIHVYAILFDSCIDVTQHCTQSWWIGRALHNSGIMEFSLCSILHTQTSHPDSWNTPTPNKHGYIVCRMIKKVYSLHVPFMKVC